MADSQFSRTLIFMLIGAAIILALSLGIRHAFGLYLVPMSEEFGWGHNVFSLAIAMQNLIWGAVQPITGAFADKYGSKIVVAVGGALYALGLLLMAVSSTGLLLNLSVGLILGLALSATSFPVLLSAVGRAAPPENVVWRWGLPVQRVPLASLLCCLQHYYFYKMSAGQQHLSLAQF